MAAITGIAWCDSTFNPWIGCTRVSPGCDACYAEALDKRHRWGGAVHWGAGVPRQRTSPANWRKPLTWQKHAERGFLPDGKTPHGGRRPRVFCASLADVFDNEAPEEWRVNLWRLIYETPNLTWLLLTKRIGNAMDRLPLGFFREGPPPNVWLGASVVNQEEADRDIPKLLSTPAAKRFVSYEPALGPVDFRAHLAANDLHRIDGGPRIDWIIVGGESAQGGAKARPFDIAWARDTVRQCRDAGVPAFVKQLGSNCVCDEHDIARNGWLLCHETGKAMPRFLMGDRAGADPAEWPADLRVQEYPA